MLVVKPTAEIHEFTLDYQNLDVPRWGAIEIEGTVVYQTLYGLS